MFDVWYTFGAAAYIEQMPAPASKQDRHLSESLHSSVYNAGREVRCRVLVPCSLSLHMHSIQSVANPRLNRNHWPRH